MEQANHAISIEAVEKSFGKNRVLDGLTIAVEPGQIYALLGANGAGKTTTIRILSTLLKPDKGRAFVGGHDVVKQPLRVREAISLTGQYAALDDVLTGRENLVMTAKLRHMDNVKGRAQEMLERTSAGVDEVARTSGFGSAAILRHHFARVLGTSPQAYRRQFACTDEAEAAADRMSVA